MNTGTLGQQFYGYVDTTGDALRLIEAARKGLIPRITRRLNDLERRCMIRSGAVFVFSVEESGIKRWTEGLQWSPSRIAGNFLIYREVVDRSVVRSGSQKSDTTTSTSRGEIALKPNGLTKKTITVKIDGSDHHLIAYFTPEDVESGKLQRPNCRPEIMNLEIPPELVQTTNFRYPPKIEAGPDGRLTQM
ncbi:Gti1/Pac2 family-domain-containing protein [Abortiporus biennis]|nr:Gti1/Pac2 family-domain-containing protein [Abortiporus biennis]